MRACSVQPPGFQGHVQIFLPQFLLRHHTALRFCLAAGWLRELAFKFDDAVPFTRGAEPERQQRVGGDFGDRPVHRHGGERYAE